MTEDRGRAVTANDGQAWDTRVPMRWFPDSRAAQEQALAEFPLLRRFADSRRELARDPHRPLYHFVSPESRMNDPNGLCFWRDNWHLFYQAYPPEDPRQHWGHAVSKDLVHWRDLPYAIAPGPEHCCYSGATWVEEDRVLAMYHGTRAGNMVAESRDPLLLNWTKLSGRPVIHMFPEDTEEARNRDSEGRPLPYRVHDPCIWRKGTAYYSLSNGTLPAADGRRYRANFLFRSENLLDWEYLHPFVEGDRYTLAGDDGACPYFLPLGDRHILLFFSHMSGGQYLLGDYDTERDRFVATRHGRFNFGPAAPCGVHAPSAAPDGQGGVVVLFNMNTGRPGQAWDQLMTLPRRLTLSGRDEIEIRPVDTVESLRGAPVHVGARTIEANREVWLHGVSGNALEIDTEWDPAGASLLELGVLRSPDDEEGTRVLFFPRGGMRHSERFDPPPRHYSLVGIDASRATRLSGVAIRAPEMAEVRVDPGEPVRLRVFIDRSVVEVYANDRQCVAVRVYPARSDSTGVSLCSRGGDARLLSLTAWPMRSIYT